jgi:hypothetical protein
VATVGAVDVTFAIAFCSREAADSAASALRSDGYDVELQRQADGSVVVAASASLARGDLDSALLGMRSLAARCGGDVLGHGGLLSFPTWPDPAQ